MANKGLDEIREAFAKARNVEMTVMLTEKEVTRLKELAELREMSENQIMVQALRLYDGVENGNPELVWKKDPNFCMRLEDDE